MDMDSKNNRHLQAAPAATTAFAMRCHDVHESIGVRCFPSGAVGFVCCFPLVPLVFQFVSICFGPLSGVLEKAVPLFMFVRSNQIGQTRKRHEVRIAHIFEHGSDTAGWFCSQKKC